MKYLDYIIYNACMYISMYTYLSKGKNISFDVILKKVLK